MTSTTKNKPERPKDDPYVKVPYWLARKAKEEHVTFDQLLTYCWLFTKNFFARRTTGSIYGKRTYKDLCKEAENDLGIFDVGDLCRALVKAGWLQKAPAKAFGNIRQVGYLCLLATDDRQQARAIQQQISLPDEEHVTEVESSAPDNGEYKQFGQRYYTDADGTSHPLPSSAPCRPSPRHIWDDETEKWYLPEDLPTYESEF